MTKVCTDLPRVIMAEPSSRRITELSCLAYAMYGHLLMTKWPYLKY